MQADGSIIIDTKIRTDGMEEGVERLKSDMGSVTAEARKTAEKIQITFSQMDVSKPIANAMAKIKNLEQQLAATTSEFNLAVSDDDDKAAERLAAKRIRLYDKLETAREKLAIEVAAAARKQAAEEEKAAQRSIKAAEKEVAAKEKAAKKQINNVTKQARKFGSRLSSILSGALVFNLISAGLREMTSYFGSALKSNDEFTHSFAKLKAALLTAFQPIYEYALPAILALMDIATKTVQAIGHIFALLSGKTDSQMAKNAEALYEQAKATEELGESAKKAQKYLAGFDEIQRVSTVESSTSTSATEDTPDFSEFSTEEYKAKIDELTAYVSGALLALGAILTFSGANIPLGIALMALGAVGLASNIEENWEAIKQALQGPIGGVVAVVSTALLALGAILAFSGANIPLGIGLMAAGAIGLATAAAVNWDAIRNALKGPVGAVVAIASGALIALGLILLFSGVGIPLGIALLAAGAAGLVTVTAVNWNAVKDKLVGAWNTIQNWWKTSVAPKLTKQYWLNTIFAGVSEALPAAWKPGLNEIIDMINDFTSWIEEKMSFDFGGFSVGGVDVIPAGTIKLFDFPEIPHLAQGAVIPPHKEFLAVLGDQPNGTNIEAPADLIRKIVREEIGDSAGMSAAATQEICDRLDRLIGAVEEIEVGDTTIGQAANRFNAKMAIMTGGNA